MALTDNILAYWNLNNNGSGGVSLIDSTPNGYTLTNNGSVTNGTGIIGGDAVYDGTGGNLTTDILDIGGATSLSLSFWINTTDDSTGDIHLLGKWDGGAGSDSFLAYLNSGVLTFYTCDGSSNYFIDAISDVFDGSWHHVVCVFADSTMELFVDGVSQGTVVAGSSLASGAGFGVGNSTFNSVGLYNGSIDETGVWNRTLSQADVTKLYNGGAGLTYPFTNALYYNNAENDGDWGNLLNWWKDSGFTIQATALPNNYNAVNLYNEVTQNTQGANQCFCYSASFWSANFGAGLTLQSTGVVNMQGSSVMAGNTTDGVSMHDSSQLAATSVVDGNVVMRDSSRAFGSILGNATIYYDGGNGQFPIGGTVTGSVTYLDWPAVSPQYFNDNPSIDGAGDGDFNNPLNWWTDDNYNVRPINSVGTQQIPDASTDVVIAPSRAIYANTGTEPLINSLTANNAELVNISITISNGATFGGDSWGMYQAVVYGNVTFNSGSYNSEGIIHGTAKYTSSKGIQYAWNDNSLVNLNSTPMAYGSTGFQVSISEGGDVLISRLLNLPWFINI
jgi:hypothetical protein